MKTIWFAVALSVLSIVVYIGLLDVLNGAGQSLLEMPGTSSVAAPPSHDAPAGVIAFDASSGGLPGNDYNVVAGSSEYVFLHKTSDESVSASTAPGLDIPWRWLRIYAVTERPTENR